MIVIVMAPDVTAPSGGVRTLYRHVDRLNDAGIDAVVWHRLPDVRCDWFEHHTPVVYGAELLIESGSVLAVPETMVSAFDPAPLVPKVLVCQNHHYLFGRYPVPPSTMGVISYPSWSATTAAIGTSRRIMDVLHDVTDVPLHHVPLSVDRALFHPREKRKVITYMPRKRGTDTLLFVELAKRRAWADGWEFVPIESGTEAETAETLGAAQIFVSFAEREGFGLPALEAIAAGCAVAGFAGDGGEEFFQPPQALPVADGNIVGLVDAVGSLVTGDVTVDPHAFDEELATTYAPETEARLIVDTWRLILDSVGEGTEGTAVHLSDAFDVAPSVRGRRREQAADALIAIEAAARDQIASIEHKAERRIAEGMEAQQAELAAVRRELELVSRDRLAARRALEAAAKEGHQLRRAVERSTRLVEQARLDADAARRQFFENTALAGDAEIAEDLDVVVGSGILTVQPPNGLTIASDRASLVAYLRHTDVTSPDPHPLISVRHLLLEQARTPLLRRSALALFMRFGAELELSPHPLFDTPWYLEVNDDVRREGINPLVHYLLHGWQEERDPNPLFSTAFYLKSHRDVRVAGLNPLVHYATDGWREQRRVHPDFAPAAYLAANPDVATAGIDPLNHYLTTGRLEARSTGASLDGVTVDGLWAPVRTPPPARTAHSALRTRVGVVSGAASLHSHLYRVEHLIEALGTRDVEAFWIADDEVTVNETRLVFCDLIVLFRTAWTEALDVLVDKAHRAGVAVVYDIDDYVFDSAIANEKYADGVRFLRPEDRPLYQDGVRRYRRMLERCDGALVTTPFLAEQVKDLGVRAHVLPNGFTDRMRQVSLAASSTPRSSDLVRIGYASGTLTHQRDFAVVADVLARLLAERADVVVSILGEVEFGEFPQLERFGARVERRPSVPHEQLPRELARFDINVAPLEIGNPYCEAKSELKWFEAALVGVPTIASATQAYVDAIDHGRTGFLASTDDEWLQHLRTLAADGQLRRMVADEAASAAEDRHGPRSRASHAAALVADLVELGPVDAQSRRPDAPQRISVLLPGVNRGSGGHGNVFALMKSLASAGRSVHCAFDTPTGDFPSVESIAEHFELDRHNIAVSFARDILRPADVVVATYWSTAARAVDAVERDGSAGIHFVQDYESWFYPMGTPYLQARDALHLPLAKVAWGHWMADHLARTERVQAAHVDYPVEHDVFREDVSSARAKDQVLLFARPDMPRRCFDLVMAVVDRLAAATDPPELVLFGSDLSIPGLPGAVVNRGVLGVRELAAMYRGATVGVAFSPSNPSNVPYEMMACGLPVIDVDLSDSDVRYGSRANVALARPTPDDVTRVVLELLADFERQEAIRRSARSFVRGFPTRAAIGERFVSIVDQLAGLRTG